MTPTTPSAIQSAYGASGILYLRLGAPSVYVQYPVQFGHRHVPLGSTHCGVLHHGHLHKEGLWINEAPHSQSIAGANVASGTLCDFPQIHFKIITTPLLRQFVDYTFKALYLYILLFALLALGHIKLGVFSHTHSMLYQRGRGCH